MHQNIDIWHLSIDVLHQNVDIWHLNIDIWPNNIGIWHLIIDIWPHNIDIYTEEFSGHPPQFQRQILGPKKTLFLHFWTVSRSERPVSTIFPSYIMPNGTCARIKKKCDTLPVSKKKLTFF